jgi:hypothetical protein
MHGKPNGAAADAGDAPHKVEQVPAVRRRHCPRQLDNRAWRHLDSAAASPLSERAQVMPRTSLGVMMSISTSPAASPGRCRSAGSSSSGKLNAKACFRPKAEHSSADNPASRLPGQPDLDAHHTGLAS